MRVIKLGELEIGREYLDDSGVGIVYEDVPILKKLPRRTPVVTETDEEPVPIKGDLVKLRKDLK
jgi:hypothetical protein